MPDLGPYAAEVLLAYGGSLGALALLVAVSARRWRRLRAEAEQADQGRG